MRRCVRAAWPDFEPQHAHKKLGKVAHVCNAGARGRGKQIPGDQLVSSRRAPVPARDPASKRGRLLASNLGASPQPQAVRERVHAHTSKTGGSHLGEDL